MNFSLYDQNNQLKYQIVGNCFQCGMLCLPCCCCKNSKNSFVNFVIKNTTGQVVGKINKVNFTNIYVIYHTSNTMSHIQVKTLPHS